MKIKLVKVERGTNGIDTTYIDRRRIGKSYFVEGFGVNMVGRLHNLNIQGEVLITSPVKSFERNGDSLKVTTTNTHYWFNVITDDDSD